MKNIYEIAHGFKQERLASERRAATALVNSYGEAWKRIKARLDVLTAKLKIERELAEKEGREVKVSWLYREERLQTLKAQTEFEIRHFARNADASITEQQREAVAAAERESYQIVAAQVEGAGGWGLGAGNALGPPAPNSGGGAALSVMGAWNRLPAEAMSNLVGTLQDGSPLKELLDQLPLDAGAAIAKALTNGVALGDGPRKIASAVRRSLGGNLVRALCISRTEVLRSYRTASIQSYRENEDVVDGWIWMASLSPRTCAACLAMSGSFHPVSEEFGSHPNCRCSPVPHTRTLGEIADDAETGRRGDGESGRSAASGVSGGKGEGPPGPPILGGGNAASEFAGVPETRAAVGVPDGKAWFAKQPADVQIRILGKAKYAAYKAGLISLGDLVGFKDSKKWGPERYEASLSKALAAASKKGVGGRG